ITWPSGKTQQITDIKPNQTLSLIEQ
ncbi:MAG: ASPIC/UnbV domain-containing protein, partial [Planctomycetes bacterium]|nr:ASPIC/UnbV domain-containing protein [Planctomycetota bacterium]